MNSFSYISKRPLSTSSRKGAALILFALALPVALGMIGLVLDGARSLYLKSRFDSALKGATLAATAAASLTDRENEAKKFFNANFPAEQWDAKVTGPTVTVTNSTVRVTASAECPTYLPNIALDTSNAKTPKTLTIQGWYETTLPNLEVVFVLSNALRSQPSDRQDILNTAVQNAIRSLSTSACYKEKYFGLVPFSNGVAIDHPNLFPNLTSRNQDNLNASFAPLAGYKFQDNRNESRWCPWIGWDTRDLTWSTSKPFRIGFWRWISNYNTRNADYWQIYDLEDQYAKPWYYYSNLPRWPAINPQSWALSKFWPYQDFFSPSAMLMARNVWPYELPYYEEIDASAANWTPFYIYGSYTRPLTGLRSYSEDFSLRLRFILYSPYSDTPQVNNLPNLGMLWSLRMLSPAWKGKWVDNPNYTESSHLPGPYGGKTHKIVVLISPGLTTLSPDIVSTQNTTNPAQLASQELKNVMNEKFQYELFKNLYTTYRLIEAPLPWSTPVNQFIPGSSCGGMDLWGCASKLDTDYLNALNRLQSGFSNSLIDQILSNLSLRYVWSSYIDNPTILPQFSGQSNWYNILWDKNTLISGALASTSWQNGSSLYFFMYNENSPYYFTNVLFGTQIITNMMDYYLKVRYHKENASNIQQHKQIFYKQVWDYGEVGGYWESEPIPWYVFLGGPLAILIYSETHQRWVPIMGTAWFTRIDYSVHTAQNVNSGIWMKIGTTYNSETNNYLDPPIYLVRSRDGASLGSPNPLDFDTWPNLSTCFWYDSADQEIFKRHERALQIFNAHQIFTSGLIQSEREYINQTNALSDTIASLEKRLWGTIPAYGILGVNLTLNNVHLGPQFNINGLYSSTISEATSRLNQAFLDVCGVIKNPKRNITVYTINVGGFTDDATMKACASSPFKHFYVDPGYPETLSKAVFSVADDIIASSAKSTLSGKSW